MPARRRPEPNPDAHLPPRAQAPGLQLRSAQVGALPILNAVFARMRLESLLHQHLPPDRRDVRLDTPRALLVLVRNFLLARQPLYGVGEWAARQAPDLLGLAPGQAAFLHDDRLGRALDRYFDGFGPALLLAVVRRVVAEFQVRLEELHNDSTSVSVYGAYREAAEEGRLRGRPTCALTFGHSKDHRPDLKQLLYILTISEDGGVPVHVAVASGNTADDQTHVQTWNFLRELVGGPDFLYVADCKLASRENLQHIAAAGGRFVSVLPATRREDGDFRQRLCQQPETLTWRWLYDVQDEQQQVVDQFWVCEQEQLTAEGWRLWWYRSRRKQELDAQSRARRLARAVAALGELQRRLVGPRTRLRERAAVQPAVDAILEEHQVQPWLQVTLHACVEERYRQAGPGRPGPRTRYVQEPRDSFELTWSLDGAALAAAPAEDGVFPLLTNQTTWDAAEVLRAYKRQPVIEKRFSQLKTDFAVAPVWLKEVSRVQALLGLYFLALLTEALVERELRQGMARAGLASLALYPEGRACRCPTASRVFEVFEPVQRHHLQLAEGGEQVLVTELTPLQRQILKLLGLPATNYGR